MPLSYSPEQTYVLALFNVVLSGLAVTLLLWMRARTPKPRVADTVLAAAFLVYALGFATFAIYSRRATGDSLSSEAAALYLAADVLRLFGAVLLCAMLLAAGGRVRAATALSVLILPVALLAAIVRWPADNQIIAATIAPITAGRLGEVAALLVGALLAFRCHPRAALGCAVLGLSRGLPLVVPFAPDLVEVAWSAEHLGTIAALLLLCLAIEPGRAQTSIRFFLRLNLTFVVLASSVIVALGAVQRHHLVELSSAQLQDLAEYVRGDLLTSRARGVATDAALSSDDLLRRLVAEFGRYPDLRRIEVTLDGRHMMLAIDDAGEVAHAVYGGAPQRRPRASIDDFAIASVVSFPIAAAGRPVGAVALDYSLRRINVQIGRQMQLIFAAFTVFVAVASVATGLLVVGAERTIGRQVDELERTRRRLTINERLASIGAVVDGAAHELNNPAGILVARTDLLLSSAGDGAALEASLREDLEAIRRQAQRIARTVKDLLAFSRPVEPLWQPFDVHDVLDSALALTHPLAAGHDIVIHRAYGDRVPDAWGDASRVEQVFTNVLANAVQAIEGHGEVTVSTARGREGVTVLIRDTGCGISAADIDRIFDPFFSTKGPGRGTGLGLSIAFGIIRDHGGSIDVTSRPGRGSEFRIVLPAVPPTGERA